MAEVKKEEKVLKFQKKRNVNIGIIIFGIIFVYLLATIVMYITAPHITVYEVRQGSILKDNAYTGLALRKEEVIYADADGYANYYVENNSKVRVGSKVYTLSDKELNFESNSSKIDLTLTDENIRALTLKIQNFNDQFHESDYASTYELKNDMQNTLNRFASQSKSEQLEQMLLDGTYSDLVVKNSVNDGIIVYAVDGMEDVTIETVNLKHLNKSGYKNKEFTNNRHVSKGDAVYKIITDDTWQLLVAVSEETKQELSDKSSIKVHFKKDNQRMRASLSFLDNSDEPIACLSFENSMIRYINERYLDIELILEDESGLKIPKSAETTKEFFVVPKGYLTQGGNSSSDGVLLQTTDSSGNLITQFKKVIVYYEENESIYLDPNVLQESTILIKPDSMETFKLGDKKSLKGVYCINKGYAVFKQIEILCESDEYYIIEEGNSFGLSNYDHIALDSSTIKENDVVF